MFQSVAFPTVMARNDKSGIPELPPGLFHGNRPGAQVGIREVAKALVFSTFYKTTSEKKFFSGKPDHNIIRGMPGAGVEGFKT